jgi:hypothetical protein
MHLMAPEPHIAGAFASRMQHRPPPALAGCIDEAADPGVDAGKAQRRLDQPDLERLVAWPVHMLQLAAATGAKMGAEGLDPVGGGLAQGQQRAALALDGDIHHLAGQSQRHEDLAALDFGDALALVAKAGNGGGDGHGIPGLAEAVP